MLLHQALAMLEAQNGLSGSSKRRPRLISRIRKIRMTVNNDRVKFGIQSVVEKVAAEKNKSVAKGKQRM